MMQISFTKCYYIIDQIGVLIVGSLSESVFKCVCKPENKPPAALSPTTLAVGCMTDGKLPFVEDVLISLTYFMPHRQMNSAGTSCSADGIDVLLCWTLAELQHHMRHRRGGGGGAYPSCHWTRGGVHLGQVARPSQGPTETNHPSSHSLLRILFLNWLGMNELDYFEII